MAPNEAPYDELALPEITLALASDTYRNELTAADTIDLKAVGLATADVAALTILVSFHKSVSAWWMPAILLAASGFCLFLVLRQRFWELGIEPKDFWDENEGKPREAILESAIAGIEGNRRTNEPFLISKAFWFRWGYRSLAIGLAALLGTTLWHAYG